jgi:hypothetical protein
MREWEDILYILKENNCQPELARLAFRNEGEITTLQTKQKAEGIYDHLTSLTRQRFSGNDPKSTENKSKN